MREDDLKVSIADRREREIEREKEREIKRRERDRKKNICFGILSLDISLCFQVSCKMRGIA